MGVVYRIRNTVNSKVYVGITTRPVAVRWRQHIYDSTHQPRLAIHRAIRKYGVEAFSFEVLEICEGLDELLARESDWIRTLDSQLPHGYNTTAGGRGRVGAPLSEEHKRKIALANTGRKNGPEMRAKMQQIALNRSPEHVAKISAARSGQRLTEATKEKIRAARAVQVFSPEVIERRAAKLRGGTHTDVAREHMSAAQKGRIVTPSAREKSRDALRRLTPQQAAIIKYDALSRSQKEYAALFQVSPQTVCCIVHGRQYAAITRDDLPEDADAYVAGRTTREPSD
jgi:group I intron endonuclease